jgi:hypothetical protein
MALGTFGFMFTEDLSLADAFYFSVVTVTTVGYGDISPSTTAGRMLAIVLIITGVGTFLGVVANSTEMLLSRRERQERSEKLHMIIGVFFSEIGNKLLTSLTGQDQKMSAVSDSLLINTEWSQQQFRKAGKELKNHDFSINIHTIDLEFMRDFLNETKTLFLRMLENPHLFEHESFSKLLMVILHLKEELKYRNDFTKLPRKDHEHLAGDVQRIYSLLAVQWVEYMKHLQGNYPYLFSLAIRTNPFDKNRSAIIQ